MLCLGPRMQRLAEPKTGGASAATCVAWAEFGGAERVVAGHKSGSVRLWDVEHSTGGCFTLAQH